MRYTLFLIVLFSVISSLLAQKVEVLSADLNKFQNVRDFCLAADEEEAYFSIQSPNQDLSVIVCVKNKQWHTPEILPFCDQFSYVEPFLSEDGLRLYFASNRPKDTNTTDVSDYDIWYVERESKKSVWSDPINMGTNVNSKNDEFYPTMAANKNLYLTIAADSGLGKDDIYYCIWDGSAYSKPILLNQNINSEGYEFNAFISKDESYLLYTKYNAKDGFGSGDLYIARKDENGEWKKPENLGDVINTKYMEYCPFYDPQQSILYFTSRRNNLSPRKFKNLKEFQDYITSSENGLSRIYKYKIKL